MNDYPLKYTCKTTGRAFTGRRVTSGDYILIDSETGLKFPVTYYRLCKNFSFDKNNKNDCCERTKRIWARVKLTSKKTA